MISIITPTHKPCVLLDLTIKSVLTQTYDDFEWVVLDNSQEGYFENYLNDFFLNNPHLEYRRDKIKIHHKLCEDYNIGRLKNECVSLTNCGEDEYVLLLDHDDFLNPRLLEYVHDLEVRYPLAQFINGDNVTLEYDIQKETFGWYCWKTGLYYEDLLKDESSIKWVSKDVNINIDDVNINFGYCTEYTLRYFDFYPVSTNMMEVLKKETGSSLHHRIACHPRIIKKHVLKNKYFAFYEGHQISEDMVQCTLIGHFLKGCYIPHDTIYNIRYADCSNTSAMYNDDNMKDIEILEQYLIDFIVNLRKLFPNLEPLETKILNYEEIKDCD